jgi:hypothetical protein
MQFVPDESWEQATVTNRGYILKAMKEVLEPVGFRRHGASFHRTRTCGFIDTITLQAGVGFLLGKDTVNLGVYIPEVAALLEPAKSVEEARARKHPKEYECQLRMRLSRLVFGEDRWFDRDAPGIEIEISSLLTSCALPYFAQFGSLAAIADGVREGRFPNSVVPPGLQAAVFYLLGEHEQARSILLRWREDNPALIERLAAAMKINW